MKKTKQQLIILGVLILAFIIIFAMASKRPQKRPSRTLEAAPAPIGTVTPKVEVFKERKTTAFQNWGRDPFAVGSTATEFGGDLVLTGILWDEVQPICIINGRSAKVGQEVSGCKILKIDKDCVTVRVGDEIRILKIGGK